MNTRFLGICLSFGLGLSAWAATPVTINVGKSLVIDDFADKDMKSSLGEWEAYPDGSGKTTLKESFVSNAGVNGTSNAIRLDYSLDGSQILNYDPYIEMVVFMAKDKSARDMSSCNEIQYEYRGNRDHYFKVKSNIDVENNYHRTAIYSTDKWQTATIHWNELYQYDVEYWGTKVEIGKVKKNMVEFMWQVQDYDGTTGFLEITNVRCTHKQAYTVNFYWGEKLLSSEEYFEGDEPRYSGDSDLKNERNYYYIKGWKPSLAPVTANASYQVVLDSAVRLYDVEFRNDEGDVLSRQQLEYGATPKYVGLDPIKLPSAEFTYKFSGWGKEVCEKECWWEDKEGTCREWGTSCHAPDKALIEPVTEDVSYYPVYTSTVNSYTVKFADYDGKVLSEKKYAYGTKMSDVKRPAAPKRAANGDIV